VLHGSPVKNDRPSVTAAWVAACRGLYELLPENERLARDDYGTRFLAAARLPRSAARMIFPKRALLYMQVRTRVIDDVMLDFVRTGGRQVVLLGAGFDCRALRFARELEGATVFEIDHPATQSKKKRVLEGERGARTEYIAWDFESRPLSELPSELASRGHDREKPTCTIWEGVTMYLTPRAIDETLRCVRDYSAAGSKLVFNYTDRARLDHPSFRDRVGARVVSAIGEQFRFGFDPKTLGDYLGERGFVLERNAPFRELAREFFDERIARATTDNRFIAVASRRPS
jgi:methyltransferase (TIGR00027 family)